MDYLNKETCAASILSDMKNIASTFERLDGVSSNTMISMYISDRYIDFTVFEADETLRRHLHVLYNRDTGEHEVE